MVSKNNIPIIFPAIILSILINTLLFLMLPLLWETRAEKHEAEKSIPVTVINLDSSAPASPYKGEKNQKPPSAHTYASSASIDVSIQKDRLPEKITQALQSLSSERPISIKNPSCMPFTGFRPDPPLSAGLTVTPPAPGTGTETRKGVYSIGEIDQPPAAIFRKKPFYPLRARLENISGEVKVKFLVDTDGNVRHIMILESRPKDVFDRSVINALSSWHFLPGKLHGRPVHTWVITTIKFRLNENG